MRRLAFGLLLALSQAAIADAGALQRAFAQGLQALERGDASGAERAFRGILEATDSPRVKLELARALYAQGRLEEAKALFSDVSMQPDTPWRVRDNIGRFVSAIEARAGYLKWGVTLLSDTNPKNIPAQAEFAIGDLVVTPAEAPKKRTGLRYALQGWKPLSAITGAYASAAYADFPGGDVDRLTMDGGLLTHLDETGRLRGKAGVELGTFAGSLLYAYPYLGLEAVLHEDAVHRITAEGRTGAVHFPDFRYLDATLATAAVSVSRSVSPNASASVRGALERSRAAERPYSYGGADAGVGFNLFLEESAFTLGATVSVGSRAYADADPLFGTVRKDRKARGEIRIGNRHWRWRDKVVSLIASLEKNDSRIGFYSYRKTGLSLLVE
jgi:hypothetical protein